MPSITARHMLKHDDRLVWITAFHCSKLMRCIVVSRVMPALLTSTSTGPPSAASIALTPSGAGGEIGDVELEDRDAGFGREFLRGLVVVAVIGGDVVAGLLQRDRDRAPDAARPAGNHSDPGHRFLPPCASVNVFVRLVPRAHTRPSPASGEMEGLAQAEQRANRARGTSQFPCRRRCTASRGPFSRRASASRRAASPAPGIPRRRSGGRARSRRH